MASYDRMRIAHSYPQIGVDPADSTSMAILNRLRWNSYASRPKGTTWGLTMAKRDLAYLLERNQQLAAQVHLLLRAHEGAEVEE